MEPGATILHADLDAFYASVEQRDDARLRGRPVIVGGGVVLAASYEAKARGVRSAMGGAQARRLCPDAIVVPPRMSAYAAASRQVFEVFRDVTPLVEPISIDEAFLEVAGLRRIGGTPAAIAARLRADVWARAGLPITVGVARTKFLAKVASGVAKPDGLLVVPPDGEREFLHPLPIERLWGVGPITAGKLRDRRIHTVGHVARIGEAALVAMLGEGAGRHLHALAHNQDARRVQAPKRRGSIGAQCALGRGPHPPAEVDAILAGLVDRVTGRMRRADRPGRTVMLRLRFGDFTRATRSRTLATATADTRTILTAARALLSAATPDIARRGLTLIGVSVGNLGGDGAVQLELPLGNPHHDASSRLGDPRNNAGGRLGNPHDDAGGRLGNPYDDAGGRLGGPRARPGAHFSGPSAQADHDLDTALDAVRERFGSASVTRAASLGRDLGPAVPLLPD